MLCDNFLPELHFHANLICVNNPPLLAVFRLISPQFVLNLLTDAPLNVLAEKSLTDIKEGESVTLTCSAIGRPDPTFTWRKDGVHRGSGPKLTFQSIRDSDSGEYRCEAKNEHGTKSNTVSINVRCEYLSC